MTSNERVELWRAKQRKENPEEFKEKARQQSLKYYHSHPEYKAGQQARFKRSYADDPEFREKIKRNSSFQMYKITPEQFEEKLKAQGGHCALCPRTTGDTSGRKLNVDHAHSCCDHPAPTCGKCNRGLLCGRCNRRLAKVEFVLKQGSITPAPNTWLEKAMEYLSKYAR